MSYIFFYEVCSKRGILLDNALYWCLNTNININAWGSSGGGESVECNILRIKYMQNKRGMRNVSVVFGFD